MSIKRRLEAVEQKVDGPEPTIVFFKTFFEGKDGSVEHEIWRASICGGPNGNAFLERQGSETFEEFEARARTAARGDRPVGCQTAQDARRGALSPTINMHIGPDASREGRD